MPSPSTIVSPPLGANGPQPANASTRLRISTAVGNPSPNLDQGSLVRLPDFLTTSFKQISGERIRDVDRQIQAAKAIFARISRLIPPATMDDYKYQATGIIFTKTHLSGVLDEWHCIDIVCPSVQACEAIGREITDISVSHGPARTTTTFVSGGSGEPLPLDILPFDVLGAQLVASDLTTFLTVLKEAMKPLGNLTGPLSVMLTTCEGKELDKKIQKVVRGYVRLSASSMQLNLEQLVKREAKWLQWVASPRVMYAHRHLECYKDWAARRVVMKEESP